MTRKNSRAKGASGEREAGKYLTSLGFVASRMGRNGYSAEDLDCRDCPVLRRLHIEVKRDESFDLHTAGLGAAVKQARRDAGTYTVMHCQDQPREHKKPVCVLWRRNRIPWRLTFHAGSPGLLVTVTGDERIKEALKWLADTAGKE